MMTASDDPYFGNKLQDSENTVNVYTSEMLSAAFGLAWNHHELSDHILFNINKPAQ